MIKTLLYQLLSSKKFVVTLVTILVWVVGRTGMDLNPDLLMPIVASLVAFVLGQGWADSGKEAAKISDATQKALALAQLASQSGDSEQIERAKESLAPPIRS